MNISRSGRTTKFYQKVSNHESRLDFLLQVIKENKHRPYVLVNEKVREEFAQFDQTDPDIVVQLPL